MDVFETALFIGCFLAAAINRFEPRPLIWIGAGIADYAVSSAYYATGLPYHAFVTAMCDASVCLSVYFFGRYKWEMGLFRAFQISVAVSLLRLTDIITGAYLYALLLELANWLAILTIIGRGLAEVAGHENIFDHRFGGSLRRALYALRHKRKVAPFHKAPQ